MKTKTTRKNPVIKHGDGGIKLPKKIKKRDGRVTDFTPERITQAVFKSFEASGRPDMALAKEVTESVIQKLNEKYKIKIVDAIPNIEEVQDFVEESLVDKGFAKVAKSYILYRQKRGEIRREKQDILEKSDIDEVDKRFDPNALRVLKSRYLKKNESGNLIEDPKTLFERVALHVALPNIFFDKRVSRTKGQKKDIAENKKEDFALNDEKAAALENSLKIGEYFLNRFHIKALYRGIKKLEGEGRAKVSWEEVLTMLRQNQFNKLGEDVKKYYDLMVSRRFMPNTPVVANFGNYLGMGSACFALDIDDSIESIMGTLAKASIVFKSGGGLGYNFSKLRPEGDFIKTTGGASSGPLSFMRLFDTMTEVVKQGGIRRGANMGIMNSNHPDIEKFITVKHGNKNLKNFNISVLIMGDFWDYYKKDKPYPLINPRTKKVQGFISPKVLLEKITYQAWESAEPGVIFYDTINEHNPLTKALGPIVTTNPCVPDDTWVMTSNGPRQVKELIGKETEVVIGKDKWHNHGQGFFLTGEKRVLNLKTREGFELSLTGNHLVRYVKKATRNVIEYDWKPAIELKIGEKVGLNPVKDFEWGGKYGEKEGYLMGHLVGDGVIYKGQAMLDSWGENEAEKKVRETILEYVKSYPHRRDFKGWIFNKSKNNYRLICVSLSNLAANLKLDSKKQISPEIEKESSFFYKGFLRGFFDTDGSVQGSQEKGVSIRLAQSDLGRLKAVQRMLLNLGIFSKIYENRRDEAYRSMPDAHGGRKLYKTKANHELIISGVNILEFNKKIGFLNFDKQSKLDKLIEKYKRNLNKERFFAIISEITRGEVKKVYDIQVPGINAFGANGVYVHNCGEVLLYPNESCNLGSLNLWTFLKNDNYEKKTIDWDGLAEAVRTAVKFLDNVIDINKFPLPEIEETTLKTRKIGLGIMGLGDFLYELEVPYNSPKGRELMEEVAEFINYHSKVESVKLAKERGPFPLFKQSLYAEGKLPFRGFYDKKSWKQDWQALANDIKKFGIRNSYTTVIAPTGSISMITGASSGIEPVYSLVYQKSVAVGSFYYIDPVFEKTMLREGLFDEDLITDVLNNNGSVQNINYIPPRLKKTFVTSHDIKAEDHIRSLAAFQRWVDSSISKTINFPKYATVEDMKKAYILAHELGVKDVAVFRDTSIKDQVLTATDAKRNKKTDTDGLHTYKDEKAQGLAVYHDPSNIDMNATFTVAASNGNGNGNGKPTHCPSCKMELSFHEGCASCPVCGWGLCS